MSNTPNPLNCNQIKDRVYLVTSQAGFRKALRLLLSKGDLVYSNHTYSRPNYPTYYPCVVELSVHRVFSEFTNDEVIVTCRTVDEYRAVLTKELECIEKQKMKLEQFINLTTSTPA